MMRIVILSLPTLTFNQSAGFVKNFTFLISGIPGVDNMEGVADLGEWGWSAPSSVCGAATTGSGSTYAIVNEFDSGRPSCVTNFCRIRCRKSVNEMSRGRRMTTIALLYAALMVMHDSSEIGEVGGSDDVDGSRAERGLRDRRKCENTFAADSLRDRDAAGSAVDGRRAPREARRGDTNAGRADSRELLEAVNSVDVSRQIGETSSGNSTTLVNGDVQICVRIGEFALTVGL
jgi:hypothetical protein